MTLSLTFSSPSTYLILPRPIFYADHSGVFDFALQCL